MEPRQRNTLDQLQWLVYLAARVQGEYNDKRQDECNRSFHLFLPAGQCSIYPIPSPFRETLCRWYSRSVIKITLPRSFFLTPRNATGCILPCQDVNTLRASGGVRGRRRGE